MYWLLYRFTAAATAMVVVTRDFLAELAMCSTQYNNNI